MNEVTLPPSPNWYLNGILSCANDGTVGWGARNSIVIAKSNENSKILDYVLIENAHLNRVTSVAFSPEFGQKNKNLLVSGGDDNIVKVWNTEDKTLVFNNCTLDEKHKIIGVDWFKKDPNIVCYVSSEGSLVTWNTFFNTSQLISLGKLTATCLACCPHESIVAVGTKGGLVYVVNVKGSGSISYKMRGHDKEIVSLSWCPVANNIISGDESRDLLLASGAKDRSIYLWKAGSDGRYEFKLSLTNLLLESNHHRHKVNSVPESFIAVSWMKPKLLYSSTSWGKLISWDLSSLSTETTITPKLVHNLHGKGLFSIAGIIEKFENESGNWRDKTCDKGVIWTLALDRLVICSTIENDQAVVKYNIPTQGGYVYCISACPLDTSRVAFGAGDAMIRLWNLSEPHTNSFDISVLWEKVKGKVRALAWHPEKENLLAFGTGEGRVGVFDTNVSKPPVLFRQYHRHTVYSVGWGPAPNVKGYALYSCSDSELIYYNSDCPMADPICVRKKDCTEFSWKPDYSTLALGFQNGSISFLTPELKEYGRTIYALDSAIQCLLWHPVSTSSDLMISSMKNYLAVTVTGSKVTVFDVSDHNNPLLEDTQKNECIETSCDVVKKASLSSFYKTVATLSGHSDKVFCLAWSPHISGYLITGSCDNTVQVWKVETKELIGTYIGHSGPVYCCMWSPFNPNLIISGSADFSIRIWKLTDQKVILPSKTNNKRFSSAKKKQLKLKNITAESKSKTEVMHNLKDELAVNGLPNITSSISTELNNLSLNENSSTESKTKKKKSKRRMYFPNYAKLINDKKYWITSVRKLLYKVKKENMSDEKLNTETSNGNSTEEMDDSTLSFFGSKEDLTKIIETEAKVLTSEELPNMAMDLNIWNDNLKQTLQEAAKEKRLTDYLVSLAPSLSVKIWQETCEAYAVQLIKEGNLSKAVTYYLCIHKVHQAVEVFINAKLYEEAYALAVLKLGENDPIVINILKEWGNVTTMNGNFETATQCYIKLKDFSKASKLLGRRKDIESLDLAIELASASGNSELTQSLAEQIVTAALINDDCATAKQLLERHPIVKHRELQIEIFEELSKSFHQVMNFDEVYTWLKGTSNNEVFENLRHRFKNSSLNFVQDDFFPNPDNKILLQINVSHQLSMSIIATETCQQLKHVLTALEMISQFEVLNIELKDLLLHLKILSFVEKRGPLHPESLFSSNYNGLSKSLKAYLCFSILRWFLKVDHIKSEPSYDEYVALVCNLTENHIEHLLDKESVIFWTTINDINKLEEQLSTGKSEIEDENEITEGKETQLLIERLDSIRNAKKAFIENRVSTPNPMLVYCCLMEFVTKIPNEDSRSKFSKLVSDTWQKAIS